MKRAVLAKSPNTDGLFHIFSSPEVSSEVKGACGRRRAARGDKIEIVSLSAGESLDKKDKKERKKSTQRTDDTGFLLSQSPYQEKKAKQHHCDRDTTTPMDDGEIRFTNTATEKAKKSIEKKLSSPIGATNQRLGSAKHTRNNKNLTVSDDLELWEINVKTHMKRNVETERSVPQSSGSGSVYFSAPGSEEGKCERRLSYPHPKKDKRKDNTVKTKNSYCVETRVSEKGTSRPQRPTRKRSSKRDLSRCEEEYRTLTDTPLRDSRPNDDKEPLAASKSQIVEPVSHIQRKKRRRSTDAPARMIPHYKYEDDEEIIQGTYERGQILEAGWSKDDDYLASNTSFRPDSHIDPSRGQIGKKHEVLQYLPYISQYVRNAKPPSGQKMKSERFPKAIYLKTSDARTYDRKSGIGNNAKDHVRATLGDSRLGKRNGSYGVDIAEEQSGMYCSSAQFHEPTIHHLQPRKKTPKRTEADELRKNASEKKARTQWRAVVRESEQKELRSFERPVHSSPLPSWDASSFSSGTFDQGQSHFYLQPNIENDDSTSLVADPFGGLEANGQSNNYLRPKKKGALNLTQHAEHFASVPKYYEPLQADIVGEDPGANDSGVDESLVSIADSHSSDSATFCASKDFHAYKLQFHNDGSGKKPFSSSTIRYADGCMREAIGPIQTKRELLLVAKQVSSTIMQSVLERLRQTPLPHTIYQRAQCLASNQEERIAQLQGDCAELEDALKHIEQQKNNLEEGLLRANEKYSGIRDTLVGMPKYNQNLTKALPVEQSSNGESYASQKFQNAPYGSMKLLLEKLSHECS